MKFLIISQSALLYIVLICSCAREGATSLPVAETYPPYDVTAVSAIAAGRVTSDGGGNIVERGFYWGEEPDLPDEGQKIVAGSGMGEFEIKLEGLEMETTYYISAFAENEQGISTGEILSFTTTLFRYGEGVTDHEGNHYNTIIVGNQEWMAGNLMVSSYRNGDPIPEIEDGNDWHNLTGGAFVWYENRYEGRGEYYGALYNWYAVADERGLCPPGWRVPGEEDWDSLVIFLGGSEIAGGAMKSERTFPDLHPRWNEPNTGATNTGGFSAFPAGYRERAGSFRDLGERAFWWSADEHGIDGSWAHNMVLRYDYPGVFRFSSSKHRGCSVRCIKDND